MVRKKYIGTKLKVFSGREARLNRAIFNNLSLQGKQTIYDLHKNLRTIRTLRHIHYGNVNRRVRALEQSGYVEGIGVQNTKVGFEATVYHLTEKAYLAFALSSIGMDDLLQQIDKTEALSILAILAQLKSNIGRRGGHKINEKHA